jgi:para-nitrobenzyl esterase
MYQFAYEGTQTAGNPPVALKAAHSMEIPFAFAHPRPNAANAIPSHELLLAKQMSNAWIAFARNGNPNHSGLPKWPAYDSKNRPTMFFDAACSVKNDPHQEERRLWQRLIAMG